MICRACADKIETPHWFSIRDEFGYLIAWAFCSLYCVPAVWRRHLDE